MQRITFERANARAYYSHFIQPSGDIVDVTYRPKNQRRVGLIVDAPCPTPAQRRAMLNLAHRVTAENPKIEILFSAGCSPFVGPKKHLNR